jgi:hypothetical protein
MIMFWLLIIAGVVLVAVGAMSLSQATMGAGLVAVACFCGILARIVQADRQQRRLQALFRELSAGSAAAAESAARRGDG